MGGFLDECEEKSGEENEGDQDREEVACGRRVEERTEGATLVGRCARGLENSDRGIAGGKAGNSANGVSVFRGGIAGACADRAAGHSGILYRSEIQPDGRARG